MTVKQLDVSVANITSTWKPRMLHHQRCGRCGIRMHVKVGVSVGRDLKTVSCLLENFRYLTFLPLIQGILLLVVCDYL